MENFLEARIKTLKEVLRSGNGKLTQKGIIVFVTFLFIGAIPSRKCSIKALAK